jgi:DNA-binding response OmpR family regulator
MFFTGDVWWDARWDMQVLLIEDSPESRQELCEALEQDGHNVTAIAEPRKAFRHLEQGAGEFHLVIVEEAMLGGQGGEFVRMTKEWPARPPVIVISRDANWSGYAEALASGAAGYLASPCAVSELQSVIRQARPTATTP